MSYLIALLLFLPFIGFVFYIQAMSKALASIDPPLRTYGPAMAWLLLIPIFNVIWFFFLLRAIEDGFEKMAQQQRLSQPVDTGYKLGIAMGCCWAACFVPKIMFIAVIPMFVFSILHWNKLAKAQQAVIRSE